MEKNNLEKNRTLKDVLDGFIQVYAQRDTDTAFPDWLTNKLCQELPEMGPEASARLADDIIGAVAAYDQTLHKLNQAMDTGESKEDWFSEQLEEIYPLEEISDDMPIDAKGKALRRMEADLISADRQFQGETDNGGSFAEAAGADEWNRYRAQATINHIGKLLYSVVLCAVANVLEKKANGEKTTVIEIVGDAFQKGMNATPDEVKAVITTAVQVSVEKGLTNILPPDTPIEVIACFAGFAVECTEALCDTANEIITLTEAMDKLGRAAFAAGCRIGAGFLRGKIRFLPGSQVLVELLSILLDYMENPQIINKLYADVRRVAVTVRERMKQSETAGRSNPLWQKLFT